MQTVKHVNPTGVYHTQKVFSQQLKGFNCFLYSNPNITNSFKSLLFRYEKIIWFLKTIDIIYYMVYDNHKNKICL